MLHCNRKTNTDWLGEKVYNFTGPASAKELTEKVNVILNNQTFGSPEWTAYDTPYEQTRFEFVQKGIPTLVFRRLVKFLQKR